MQKLNDIRRQMASRGLAAYIIPGTDPHQSEYMAAHWKGRDWASGFDGSAGTLFITHKEAWLLTDGRYFLQAERQLQGSGVSLMKQQVQGAPEYIGWLAANLQAGEQVGIDGSMFSMQEVEMMREAFGPKHIELQDCGDLLSDLWENRPPLPLEPVFEHELVYAGKSRVEKLSALRAEMQRIGGNYHLLTALDDIAWLLNLRGSDIDYNPVFISYALVGLDDVALFVHKIKITEDLRHSLESDGVYLFDYETVEEHVAELPDDARLVVDASKTNFRLFETARNACQLIRSASIPTGMKALKNAVELDNLRRAMEKDGVAMLRFLMWLEQHLGKEAITEYSAGEKLREFRAAQPLFYGESFSTIAGYKSNGAIIHYRADAESCATLAPEGLFLLDSGGQYHDGTTDITRTLALGPATDEEKRDYTLVLKGHIALAKAVFPAGTAGGQLDVLTRQYLWAEGLKYLHGTGHGVGFFLNVHEPPQRIGQGLSAAFTTPLQPGMLTSNEPGMYRNGKHGIRIENLVVTVPYCKSEDFGEFYAFETVTLCPIATNLIERSLMRPDETEWLNAYHRQVFERLSPYLSPAEQNWLQAQTQELPITQS